jgi:nuclear transport factor 2 (NTF2) superfamily protein
MSHREFNDDGLMAVRRACIDGLPVRPVRMDVNSIGRPDDYLGLGDLNL